MEFNNMHFIQVNRLNMTIGKESAHVVRLKIVIFG